MPIISSEEFFNVLENCDTESLYAASHSFAASHKSYSSGGNGFSIDKTSRTVMGDMLAKTGDTPADQIDDMRSRREKAIEDFCYIYGGYIAYNLRKKLHRMGYKNIPLEDKYISTATGQVLNSIIRNLNRYGYKEGTFSHLVHQSIKNKAIDVKKLYINRKKKNPQEISFENAQEILGGKLEVDGYNGTCEPETDFDERKLEVSGIMQLLKSVKTKNSADDYNMFILNRIYKHKLQDVAEKFDISIATASRRINDFAVAAITMYNQKKREMENYQ